MNDSSSPKNIKISTLGNEICESLEAMGLFPSALEAYRAAISVALAMNLEPDIDVKFDMNKWDTASVFRDADRDMEALLLLMGIEKDKCITTGMQLAESGLRYLNDKRIANVDLVSILVGRPALE